MTPRGGHGTSVRARPAFPGSRPGAPVRRPGGATAPGRAEPAACLAVIAVAVLALACWAASGIDAVLGGHGWRDVPLRAAPALVLRILVDPSSPVRAFPRGLRPDLPGATGWWATVALVLATAAAGVVGATMVVRRVVGRARPGTGPAPRGKGTSASATWAASSELRPLAVRAAGSGRLVLGRAGRRLVAAERGHSLLVVGPSQSGKTTGLAIPAILEWQGPVLATSVKTDLVRDTLAWRRRVGTSLVYDPAGVSGLRSAGWSPLAASASWAGARRVAAALCSVARAGGAGLDDAAFWYATAEKLLAPLLFAAASSGGSMPDVVRWVDTEEVDEVLFALELAGVDEAVRAAEASFGREDRQRSSVYTTAETVLAAFADPSVAATTEHHELDPALLLDGGHHTFYLVAPSHEQERLQTVFVAILRSVVEAAFETASRADRALDPPLLVVLDEAANVAPLAGLDALAATASSHGIQVVTVWQDLAQVEARYGARWATVVNNHRAKLVCSGVADPATLEHVSRLVGDEDHVVDSTTVDEHGATTRTASLATRRLLPADMLRRLAPGEAVLLYGHLPPVHLALRPFFAERSLRRLMSVAHAGARRDAPPSDGPVVWSALLSSWRGRRRARALPRQPPRRR